jgi:hypothetical protein
MNAWKVSRVAIAYTGRVKVLEIWHDKDGFTSNTKRISTVFY